MFSLTNAVAGLELYAVVLLSLVVLSCCKPINAVAGLGLQATMLSSLVVLVGI